MKQIKDKVKANIPRLKTCGKILLLVLFTISCVNEYYQHQRRSAREAYRKAMDYIYQYDDYEHGVIYLKEAAEKGHSKAQMLMGDAYEFGKGVKRDCNQALYWYHKAEENGNSFATTSIGWMYLNGSCFNKDKKKAAEWFKKAADKGEKNAQHLLKAINEGKIK